MKVDQQLTAISEEGLQQLRATSRQNAAPNLHAVIQLRMIHNLYHRVYGPGLRIIRPVDQPLNACVHQRTRAHGARLNCSKELTVHQAMVADGGAGRAQCHNLCVRRWVGVGDVVVCSAADYPVFTHHHGSYWNFASFQGALCRPQSLLHPEFVGSSGVLAHFYQLTGD
jgi:hypothetical protein